MSDEQGQQQGEAVGADDQQQTNLTQDQINKLVKGRAREMAEKARAEERQRLEQEYAQKMQQAQAQQQSPTGQQSNVNPDDIAKQVQEKVLEQFQQQQAEAQKEQQRQQIQQIVDSYKSKMQQGKEIYEDFDEVTKSFDPGSFPEIVALVSGMDNAPQIIYELSQNPNKVANISYLAQRSEATARSELNRLANSISANEQAVQSERSAPEPINHQKPSSKAGADTGINSVADWKKVLKR